MKKFIIASDDFSIGEIIYSVDKENSCIDDLTIIGNIHTFEKLSYNEDGPWGWTLDPPEFYIRAFPFDSTGDIIEVIIKKDQTAKSEVGLYLMEHNSITGTLTIEKNGLFIFNGTVDLFGETMKLELQVNLK